LKKIQYVSRYISLSQEGLVPKLECPLDQGFLFCNGDGEDEIFLYCLECNYKNNLGLQKYNEIVQLVNDAI